MIRVRSSFYMPGGDSDQSGLHRGASFRFRALVLAAAVLLIAVGYLAIALAADRPETIQGVWEGRYVCGQGPAGLTLTISGDDVKQITARLHFYALPENPGVPSGEYELNGSFDPVLGRLDLKPTKWVDRPDSYNMVALQGTLEEDRQSVKGAIDAAGCGPFVLARAGEGAVQAEPAQTQPRATKSLPSNQDQSELDTLNQQVIQLYQAGKYDQAVPIAESALALAERLHGLDDPTVVSNLKTLALLLENAKRFDEAEPLRRRALAIDEKNRGLDDSTVASDRINLELLLQNRDLQRRQHVVTDPVLIALTGQLANVLERAVPLAFVVSLLLLWIYLRAVKRSMRHRACADTLEPPSAIAETTPASTAPALPLQIVTAGETEGRGPTAPKIESHTLAGPWRTAAVYTVAGLAYAVTLTTLYLGAGGLDFLPLRFLFFALTYAWPVVLTVGLVAAISWRGWLAATGVYFLLLAAVTGVAIARSDTFTWDQAIQGWRLINVPGTVLVLAFLVRPIRAVAPMVLVFMIAAVGGLTVWQNVLGPAGGPRSRQVIELFVSLGLGGVEAAYAIQLGGAVILGLIGWVLLRGLGSLYRVRLISDQSILIDSTWLLFALTRAIDFAFFSLSLFLAPFAAFAVYKIVALVGFALLREKPAGAAPDPKLLLLRVFSLGRRSAQLFNAFGKLWRYAGSIRLIAGPDLATTTVEPHEFLDFLSGKLARRFISGPETLSQRLAETEPHRDFDGRYRVSDFFCHDDTWKMVLGCLARESDAVLMDLRGFSPSNKGCLFEINELLNVVPFNRVVFVVDGTTDIAFLREMFAQGWAALRADSPNRELAEPRVLLFRFTGTGDGSVPSLVRAVAGATKGRSTHG